MCPSVISTSTTAFVFWALAVNTKYPFLTEHSRASVGTSTKIPGVPFIPGDQASEQRSLLEGQVLWGSASWGQQKTDPLTHFGLSCRRCRCYPGTGEVIGQVECWSLCPCWWSPWSVFSRPQFERNNQIILSAYAYDEFSCTLSQNPYFSVTNLLFSQNWRLVGSLCFTAPRA